MEPPSKRQARQARQAHRYFESHFRTWLSSAESAPLPAGRPGGAPYPLRHGGRSRNGCDELMTMASATDRSDLWPRWLICELHGISPAALSSSATALLRREPRRQRLEAMFEDALEQIGGLLIAHVIGREPARPLDARALSAVRLPDAQRGHVARDREVSLDDRVAVAASGVVERLETLHDDFAAGRREVSDAPALAQLAPWNVG